MNVIPFGRTPAERRRNAEAAAFVPDWRSKYPSRPEARRATILDAKTCKGCGITVDWPNGRAHPTGKCRDCRSKDMTVQGPEPPPDPSLF